MKKSILLFAGLFCITSIYAQWSKTDKFGGRMTDITKINGVYYASSLGGVVKSEDNGATWTEISKGLGMDFNEPISATPIESRTNNTTQLIYLDGKLLALVDHQWYRSSYSSVDVEGLYQFDFQTEEWKMVVDIRARNLVVHDHKIVGIGSVSSAGVFQELITIDPTNMSVTSTSLPGDNLNKVFEAADGELIMYGLNEVYTTFDLQNFTALNMTGIDYSMYGVYKIGSDYYAGYYNGNSSVDVWHKYNNGVWHPAGGTQYGYYLHDFEHLENGNLVGFFLFGSEYRKYIISEATGYSALAAGNYAPYYASEPNQNGHLLATNSGVLNVADLNLPAYTPSSIGIHFTDDNFLASNHDFIFRMKQVDELERSNDAGQTWEPVDLPSPGYGVIDFDADEHANTIVLWGYESPNGNVSYVSHDNGETWQETSGYVPHPDHLEVINDSVIVYRHTFDDELVLSTDGGATMADLTHLIALPDPEMIDVAANETKIWAAFETSGEDDKVFESSNNGQTWDELSSTIFSSRYILSIDFINGNLYVLTGEYADFKVKIYDPNTWTLMDVHNFELSSDIRFSFRREQLEVSVIDSVLFIEDVHNLFYKNMRYPNSSFQAMTEGCNMGMRKHRAVFYEDHVFIPTRNNGTFYMQYPVGFFDGPGGPVGIEELETSAITLYPNPVGQGRTIHIESDQPIESISIYSMNGAMIQSINAKEGDVNELQLSDQVQSGLYLVYIQNANHDTTIHKLKVH